MTNNTQLLPCPFCGVRCKGYPVADTLSVEGDHKTWCPFYYTDPIVKAVDWNTRAAPAEDVRAVVEEPVGYASDEQLKRMAKGHTETLSLCAKRSHIIDPVALYGHPQRPVVLPERKQIPVDYSYRAGWNACLAAVEELNK